MSRSFNLALGLFVQLAFTNIEWKAFMIFGTFCAVMIFHVYFFYLEACGKTLEDIKVIFNNKVPAWKSAGFGERFEEKAEISKQKHITPAKLLREESRAAAGGATKTSAPTAAGNSEKTVEEPTPVVHEETAQPATADGKDTAA